MAFFRFVKDQLFVTPPYPTQDFTGQTVIVTGANVGLGLEASRHFTRLHAATVILGVRDLEKGEQAKRSIEESTQRFNVVHVWPLDLSRYQSVEDFARRVHTLERLDVLVENAGVVAPTYREYEDDEATITVNVVSTFLLALLVLPKLQETATRFHVQPHLVIVSSEAHGMASMAERKSASIFEALRDKETARMQDRYNVSKLLEVFYCRELALHHQKSGKPLIVINYVNPGLCHSQLTRELGFSLNALIMATLKLLLARTTEVGGRTLVAAAAAGPGSHGQYQSNGRTEEYVDGAVRADVPDADDFCSPSPFVMSEEGGRVQKRVYEELSQKLEKIHPGIIATI